MMSTPAVSVLTDVNPAFSVASFNLASPSCWVSVRDWKEGDGIILCCCRDYGLLCIIFSIVISFPYVTILNGMLVFMGVKFMEN